MRKTLTAMTAAGLLSAGVLAGAVLNPLASAAQDEPAPTTEECAGKGHGDRHHRRRFLHEIAAVSAEAIGIPQGQLVSEVRKGQTIAQVAEANAVEPQTVQDALVAAATAKIDGKVASGDLDAERAAKLKARLPELAERVVNSTRGARGQDAAA